MTVTLNATGTERHQGTSVTTDNYTGITVASGSGTVLLYCFSFDQSGGTAAPSAISAVWDPGGANQSLSLLGYVIDGATSPNGSATGIFGLRNPTPGNKTLTLSWTTSSRLFAAAIAFDGVDTTSDATAFPHSASTNSFPVHTVSVTSATGNKVLAAIVSAANFTGITGTTIYADWAASNFQGGAANYDNGAASVSIGSTTNANALFATDVAATAGAAANPNNQFNWPTPRAPDYPLFLRTWVSQPQSPFPPFTGPKPFAQSYWPVPVARQPASDLRTFINDLPFQLIGKDLLPFRQKDWPVPTAPRPAADLRTFIKDTPIHLIGKDRLPVRQQDWPAPLGPQYPISLRAWVNDPQAPFPPFAAAAFMPGRVVDWGTLPQPDNISLRTFIAINPALLATSPPPPVLMPPLIVEWGVIDRTTFAPASIQYNVPLLTQPTRLPFNQADWPVPPTPQRAADLRTFINDLQFQLIGKDQLPVRQQIWPVPIAPDYSVSLRSFLASPGLPLITAPVQAPFSQKDWSLPIAALQPVQTWTQSPTIATPVVAPTFMPGRVSEWGMWQSVAFTPADLPPNIALQPTVAVQYVFRAPYDSPQWAGARFETWTTTVNLALRAGPPPQKPFAQTDWPLTQAARQPDRTFQRGFPPELIGKDRLPVEQQDWPLTPATEFSKTLRSIGFRSPALDVIAPRPFRQQDWPLPIAPRPAADLRTYIAQSPIRLIGKDRLPFRQQYWPLTPAPREFHTLRSITQGRVIYGGEVAPIPPIPPLPPPEVIHSVRAHADAYYGVFFADEIKGRADFSRAKGIDDEEAAN